MITLASISLLLGGASLSAQDVPVTTSGQVSVTNALPPTYNGQYVLQTTDFGFLWLDTVALQGGLVEAESSCAPGMPSSSTNIYVVGDCNGTGTVSTSGSVALVRQFNSQCGAATRGCDGPSIRGPARLTFALGTWRYLGDLGDIPDSTQTADPQGRTWTVQPVDTTGRNFNWHANGNPNEPPTANAIATNLSAASRADKANYYGDKWQLQDASVSPVPITRIDWDFLYKTFFSPDEVGAPATEATVTGYFGCDPSGGVTGAIRTGASCMQSLGLTNPAAPNSYRFAMQSANQNGTSTSPFISSAVPFVCPQATILGYTGFSGTCAKTSGTLNILGGGTADASASQGNLTEASVNWNFTGPNPISVQGAIVPVPSGATGFTLAITYPGGYQATAQGSIVQASLIPAFSVAPDPVLLNASLTLTNQMQVGNATLNSVNSVISPGACSSSFNAFASAPQLPASFLSIAGTAGIQAPASVGGYCVNLKYNYTPQGQPQQSQVVSNPFSAMNWAASPQIGISPVPFCTSSCQLQAGTTYSLWDSETITASPHPGASWDLSGTPIGTSSDANVPISWTPTSACSSCTLRVTVNGSVATLPVTVSGPVAPTATPTATPTPTPTATNTPSNTPTPTPTPPPPPTVTTNAATGVAKSSATLTGTVNPNGTATSVSFDYGTTTSYGSTTALQSIGAGSSAVAVSQQVPGLICGTSYHFRAVATTPYATTRGLDQAFRTTACSPASFYTVQPCRIADTRNPNGPSGGPALAAGDVRNFPVAGLCGIPASATAIVVNLAVSVPTDQGDLRAHPAGGTAPMASSLNFRPGIVRSNSTVIPLGAGGQVAIQCDMPSGSTNVFLDVFGYFQ